MAEKIDEEIKKGVEDMKKESPAAGYKAEKNVERVDEFLKPDEKTMPSDSDR